MCFERQYKLSRAVNFGVVELLKRFAAKVVFVRY